MPATETARLMDGTALARRVTEQDLRRQLGLRLRAGYDR